MKDFESRRSMETMLKQMVLKAAYGLFDPDTSLEFIETKTAIHLMFITNL